MPTTVDSPYPSAMQFSRSFLNRPSCQPDVNDTVVVIDVLRSFTTASVVLAKGASAIYLADGLAAAAELLGRIENPVSVGALAGGDPAPGFDFGNSPSELMRADLAGKTVVLCTAAGVRGLHLSRQARRLYAAGLACARATAEAIRATDAQDVCFVITGEWTDRDGDEDVACADYIESLLRGNPAKAKDYARRVRKSDFGRRFTSEAWPNLPQADLEFAARADFYEFAMKVERDGDHLLIRGLAQQP